MHTQAHQTKSDTALTRAEGDRRRSRRPQVRSLLLSSDPELIRAVTAVAQREEVQLDTCSDGDSALLSMSAKAALAVKAYQAILVDFDMPGVAEFLRWLRERKEKPVTVAMVASGTLLGTAFDVGAVLAIHKPVSVESLRLGLRAAYAVGSRQGRRGVRRAARIPCRVGLTGSRLFAGSMVNVSEGGACVSSDRCILPGTFVTLRFALPGAEPVYDVGAVAVWNDGEGHTGLRFQRLHYRHAGRIRNWVGSAADPVVAGKRSA